MISEQRSTAAKTLVFLETTLLKSFLTSMFCKKRCVSLQTYVFEHRSTAAKTFVFLETTLFEKLSSKHVLQKNVWTSAKKHPFQDRFCEAKLVKLLKSL